MNASYAWLKAFVDFDETPPQLRDLLTSRVATVDELVPLRTDLSAIVVARVVEEGPHPDSDHLHVTKVDAGTGTLLDVVCGAPNVTAGKLYPFAMSGTVMPNGLKIEKRKIRGATSNGMICSAKELGLGDDHEGVMELAIDVPPGTPFLRAMPVGDNRIVIDVGANRPDLLSHLGIAREIAAATGRPLGLPLLGLTVPAIAAPVAASAQGKAGAIAVSVDDASLVRRFMGVVIRGVKVGPSPQWLVDRLASIGSRSINNVVDASNYLLHELGQPTHAFDLAKLGGPEVHVRLARAGERITTLDRVERTLTPEMIVIADSEKPQAVAGIMGGHHSEVTDATTDLFIEVANFDPRRVRAARRTLGISSDASYRFERGVDVELAPRALERLAQIVIALAGGDVDGAPVDLRVPAPATGRIALRTSRVAQVLGVEIPADAIIRHLTSIGFDVTRGDDEHLGAIAPSWRPDVISEIDLVEEIARLHGYDAFPDEIRPFRPSVVPDDPQWIRSRRIRDQLVGSGVLEVRPVPFVTGGAGYVRVQNPIADNEGFLRRSVIESLARRCEHNLAHMQRDIRLFEIGDVFTPSTEPLPREELHVGVLLMGRRFPRHFTDPGGEEFERWATFDGLDAEALAMETCRTAFPGARIEMVPSDGAPQSTPSLDVEWLVQRDGETIGQVGRVIVDAPVWAPVPWGIEISLGIVDSTAPAGQGRHSYVSAPLPAATRPAYRALPTTPAAELDLALLLGPGQTAAEVERVIRTTGGELLERVVLFDQYTGEALGPGMRSVAWRLTFRHPERTLRDKEIEGRRARILSALEKELNVRQRTT